MNKLSPAKCKKYNTGHFLATGPSFSSLASSGSTIVLNRHYDFQDEEDEEDGCEALNGDLEFTMPLKDGESGGGEGDADRDSGPNPSSGIGNMRRVPRTNSYYHRAGMTPRLDDMHFLANAPSFSSVATTATNVTDARLSSMASLANNSFVGRNGLSAAAMSMASTSSLHNDPRFALGRTASATSTSSGAGPAGPISSSTRPLGTGNIFLQQDDTDYQNLLTSIATSNGIAMAPVAASQTPESSAASAARTDGPASLRRTPSKSNTRHLSDGGTFQLDAGSRKTSHTGGMRRSSSSAVSILRRGRYSSGYLSSVREYQDGDQSNTIHDNKHNESFNNSNNVKFTAPTIHLIGDDDNNEVTSHQQSQHHDEKEQTVDNAEDFDEDEQIPADILAAFAGDAIEGDSSVRRSSGCSSLSFFPDDDDDESLVDIVAELNDERGPKKSSGNDNKKPKPKHISKDNADGEKLSAKQRVPPEVTAVGRYYEDDELDEYLFTGIQSLQVDDRDKAGTTAASHKSASHTSNRHCQSAGESMSTLSTQESKRSVIS